VRDVSELISRLRGLLSRKVAQDDMGSKQEQYQRQGTEQHEETVQTQAMMSKPVLNALKHVTLQEMGRQLRHSK
jgi:hypothetical protein